MTPPTMKLTVAIENAPSVIAGIVKEGLTFDAVEKSGYIVITFLGGY